MVAKSLRLTITALAGRYPCARACASIREQSCSARVRPRAAQARCLRYLKSLLPSVYDLALVPIVCYIAVDSLTMVQFIDPWAVGLYCAAAGVILLLALMYLPRLVLPYQRVPR